MKDEEGAGERESGMTTSFLNLYASSFKLLFPPSSLEKGIIHVAMRRAETMKKMLDAIALKKMTDRELPRRGSRW
jgi:hypothetical protein